jgi:ABC-type sugar transport system substrate-binding protein
MQIHPADHDNKIDVFVNPCQAVAAVRHGAGGKLFGVSFQTMNNPFFVDLNKGLQAAIEAKGDKLVTLDAQFNSLKQKNDIADLLQQQPAAIFINPVNREGIKGTLIEARRANVPVIIVDEPLSTTPTWCCARWRATTSRPAASPARNWRNSSRRPRLSFST